MRGAKILTTAVTVSAVALSLLVSAIPASATTTGFHAAWVAQSAYATAQPGQVIQMSTSYQNTGDQPWIQGRLGTSQANFATAAPRDNTTLFTAGWAAGQGWLAPNRYAAQANALVVTSQLGSWAWTAKVPAGTPAGDVFFYGVPVIDGVGFMEDYGFFLKVTVQAGPVTITGTLPASPSTSSIPIVQGSGAGGSCAVTVYDGSIAVGSGTSDSSGTFSLSAGPLGAGSHNLTASSVCAAGLFLGAANTFVYQVTGTPTAGGTAAALNTREIQVNFGQCVSPAGTPGGFNTAGTNDATNPLNYNLNGLGAGVGITRITMNGDNASVTVFTTAALPNPSGDTIVVSTVTACTGSVLATITAPFVVNDASAPAMAVVSASALAAATTTAVTVQWTEPIGTAGAPATCVGTYAIDSVTAISAGHPTTSPTGQRQCALTAGTGLTAGTTHTLSATSEKDQGNNTQSPNPQSISFTVATIGTLTLSSGTGSTETVVTLNWNGTIDPTTGTPTCTSPTLVAIACSQGAPASASPSQQDITLTTPFAIAGCATFSTCAVGISITGVTGLGGTPTMVPGTQSTTATITKDTTAPTLASASQVGTTQNTFDLIWSEKVSGPLACVAGGTCAIRILNGSSAIIASSISNENAGVSLTINACDNVAGDTKTRLTLTANGAAYAACAAAAAILPGANDTLTIAAAAVNDLAGTPNPNTAGGPVALAVNDTVQPTLVSGVPGAGQCGAGQPCKVFVFTFSEKMSATATNIANYKLNNSAVSGTPTINLAGTVVTLTLLADAPCAGAGPCAESFLLSNLTDASTAPLSGGQPTSPSPIVVPFNRTP